MNTRENKTEQKKLCHFATVIFETTTGTNTD